MRRVLLFTLASERLKTGEFGRAQESLDILAKQSDDASDEFLLAMGQAVLGARTPAEAPRELLLQAGRAQTLAARLDIARAGEAYVQLAANAPNRANIHFAAGRFLVATGQNDAAVAAFKKELEVSPRHLLARLGIAGVLLATDPGGALPYAEEAVKLSPNLGEAHFLLGSALLDTDHAARAIVELETARRLVPNEAKVHFALSRAYSAVGRRGDAARARETFARLNGATR
jgi:predicted Zn-dependent protease